jgi:outer membrane protein TolC
MNDLTREALASRHELKSLRSSAEALRSEASATRAAAYPSLSAFGDGVYANPNSRLFPASPTWYPTWSAGVQLTWSPTDIPIAINGAASTDARASALDAQASLARQGIELEVTRAFVGVREADVALEASQRALSSATEAYRVARDLFLNNALTSTTLTDAEAELVRARLQLLSTSAEARIARARLAYAVGRENSTWRT